jgi:hypothetical protein
VFDLVLSFYGSSKIIHLTLSGIKSFQLVFYDHFLSGEKDAWDFKISQVNIFMKKTIWIRFFLRFYSGDLFFSFVEFERMMACSLLSFQIFLLFDRFSCSNILQSLSFRKSIKLKLIVKRSQNARSRLLKAGLYFFLFVFISVQHCRRCILLEKKKSLFACDIFGNVYLNWIEFSGAENSNFCWLKEKKREKSVHILRVQQQCPNNSDQLA